MNNAGLVLLVEGREDREFVYQLCNHAKIQRGAFAVKPKEGFENLAETLEVEIDASGLLSLGMVVDADFDLAARWLALTDRLKNMGYTNLPLAPDPAGTVIEELDKPKVGVWIMPDNQLTGMIEDFASSLIRPSDRLWQRAKRTVAQIPQAERRFKPEYLAKAQIHTWLAWQEEPGTPIGLAITRRYFDAHAPVAQTFLQWLSRLFALQLA